MLKTILKLLFGIDVLILLLAVALGLGFVFLAGAAPLLMAAPIGIFISTAGALALSIKLRTANLAQVVGFAATPLVFAPIWYGLIYKIVESKCAGWSCF